MRNITESDVSSWAEDCDTALGVIREKGVDSMWVDELDSIIGQMEAFLLDRKSEITEEILQDWLNVIRNMIDALVTATVSGGEGLQLIRGVRREMERKV